MSKAERIFEVTIIILGMTIVYISFALIVSYIVESEVSGYMGRRRMEKKLKRLKDHVIVCGYGRMVGA